MKMSSALWCLEELSVLLQTAVCGGFGILPQALLDDFLMAVFPGVEDFPT